MNSNKYHYIAVTKPNALLAKFLSNHVCLNFFCNFWTDEMLKKHESCCKDHDHHNMLISKMKDGRMEEVAGNILKHLRGYKCLY